MGPPASDPSPRADPAEGEACRFLEHQVEPTLLRQHEQSLTRAVRGAVRASDLSALGQLPERQRRHLLAMIEERLDLTRTPPSPRAVVRLTAALTSASEPADGSGRQLASPAR